MALAQDRFFKIWQILEYYGLELAAEDIKDFAIYHPSDPTKMYIQGRAYFPDGSFLEINENISTSESYPEPKEYSYHFQQHEGKFIHRFDKDLGKPERLRYHYHYPDDKKKNRHPSKPITLEKAIQFFYEKYVQ